MLIKSNLFVNFFLLNIKIYIINNKNNNNKRVFRFLRQILMHFSLKLASNKLMNKKILTKKNEKMKK